MAILTVEDLSKSYGRIQALKKVSFSVPEGSVFGILGPNGSGKTTMLGTIMDILKPTSGTYKLFDEAPTELHRRRIGTLLETPNFYHYLSGVKNLEIAAEIKQHGKEDIPRVLEMVDLTKRKDSKFSTYSLGMKQRLAIASCLLGNPKVLVFDEPTNGLDPVGIAEIRELMKTLYREGKTIIMASHLLDEVEKVCTHVAILRKGELITSGDVNEILSNEDMVEVGAKNSERLIEVLQKMPGQTRVTKEGGMVKVFYPVGTADLEAINNFCFGKDIILNHLILKKKSLESRFFELTNN
ncbi:ATP-binding cassette domain-containing protein [Ginsengibacter hankyongi]|uniref:ATP-binding cassette domain-containing protein n=1 Tax=Ginsengibacter hankyongi TaxID=2607284 RepID=A0A5J5IJZ9_9BACT|nr:ATP-binding cassette domain-containing protein [Ginsengibacter hankyongi]KAA9041415.1 ATP-binding cassette domain-containing protein [Ginsengibacter hankyongi]